MTSKGQQKIVFPLPCLVSPKLKTKEKNKDGIITPLRSHNNNNHSITKTTEVKKT